MILILPTLILPMSSADGHAGGELSGGCGVRGTLSDAPAVLADAPRNEQAIGGAFLLRSRQTS